MKTSREKPPVWDKLVEKFGVSWDRVIVTYGDTVYSKNEITGELIDHESVHIKQQTEMGVEKWWDRYFSDPDFRVSQEVEAYKAQYKYIKGVIKDRNLLLRQRDRLARQLSSSIYGNPVTFEQAVKLLS